MAEHILIPQRNNLEREDFLELLLRRMDHDFGNSFVSSKNVISALRREPTNEEHAKRLLSYVTHLDYITKALKNLGLGQYNPSRFNLETTLDKLKIYTEQKWGHQVDISLDVQKNMDIVNFQEPIYAQVWNFISNATYAYEMPPSNIDIFGKELELNGEQLEGLGVNKEKYSVGDPFVVVSVRDYGQGIPEERLPLIFGNAVSFRESNGIGLALAEATSNLIHGFVKVESEIGKGSIFSLYLPKEHQSH